MGFSKNATGKPLNISSSPDFQERMSPIDLQSAGDGFNFIPGNGNNVLKPHPMKTLLLFILILLSGVAPDKIA